MAKRNKAKDEINIEADLIKRSKKYKNIIIAYKVKTDDLKGRGTLEIDEKTTIEQINDAIRMLKQSKKMVKKINKQGKKEKRNGG